MVALVDMWLVWSGSAKGLFGSYDELKILKHDTVLELPFFLGWRKYFTCVGKYNSLMHGGRFQRTTPSHKKKVATGLVLVKLS